jgi:hypothetical protein
MINARHLALWAIAFLSSLITPLALAQIEGCALGLGRNTANGGLVTQPVFNQPTQAIAAQFVAQRLLQPPLQYINGESTVNGAVALVVYQNTSGQLMYHFRRDTTALGAINAVLFDIGGPGLSRSYAPYVKWVRCNNTPPVMQQQLAQLTWSSSLTSHYSGYQVSVIEMDSHTGSLHMRSGATAPPPSPTPAPQAWGSGGLVGCWQRYDYADRVDGNVVSIGPPMSSPNLAGASYEGKHLMLSAAQAQHGRQVGGWAISLRPAAGPPGSYTGSYETLTGSHQMESFTASDAVIAGHMRSPSTKFTWRRVACPR